MTSDVNEAIRPFTRGTDSGTRECSVNAIGLNAAEDDDTSKRHFRHQGFLLTALWMILITMALALTFGIGTIFFAIGAKDNVFTLEF